MTSRREGAVRHWHQYLHPSSHTSSPTLFRWSSRLLDTVSPPTQCGFSYIWHLILNLPGGQLHLCVFSPAMSGYKNIPPEGCGAGGIFYWARISYSCCAAQLRWLARYVCQLQRTCKLSGSGSSQHSVLSCGRWVEPIFT